MLDSFKNEFIVVCQVENAARGTRVTKLSHGLMTNGHLNRGKVVFNQQMVE